MLRPAMATTVPWIVTPNGIVLGADGKVSRSDDRTETMVKIALLNGRIALAGLGLQRVKSLDGHTTLYDFPIFARAIDRTVSYTYSPLLSAPIRR